MLSLPSSTTITHTLKYRLKIFCHCKVHFILSDTIFMILWELLHYEIKIKREVMSKMWKRWIHSSTTVCEIPSDPIDRGYQKLTRAFPVVIIMDLLSIKIFRSMKDLQMLDRWQSCIRCFNCKQGTVMSLKASNFSIFAGYCPFLADYFSMS